MAVKAQSESLPRVAVPADLRSRLRRRLETFPWWLVAMALLAVLVMSSILNNENYRDAFNFIRAGLTITLTTTISAFGIALVIGLVTGLLRISNSVVLRNAGTFYVEVIRGVPMMVLIFFIALVVVPGAIQALNALGHQLYSLGLTSLGNRLTALDPSVVSMNLRAVVALSITYGAFLAEIFRAGIQSIGRGQMEAARSQGMSYTQAMRYVILPQAVRNVLPALGNDFVSMLKDSSLVSILAVRDITQYARLYAGRSFQFQETYTILAVLYLVMTVLLSFVVKYLERRYGQHER